MSPTFEDFALHPAVVQGLGAFGFKIPTPVQSHAIPPIMDGDDVVVIAPEGSGKTLAYVAPLLSLIDRGKRPQALVIAPDGDAVMHVYNELMAVCRDPWLSIAALHDGVALLTHEKILRKGMDLIIGTPDRLRELLERRVLDLSGVRIIVIDQANEILDWGLLRDVDELWTRARGREQTLLFATKLVPDLQALIRRTMKAPNMVKLTPSARTDDAALARELGLRATPRPEGAAREDAALIAPRGGRGDGDRPRGDGDRPRGDGDRSRGDGDRSRGDGDRSRGDGDRPRGDGDRPRGDRPRGDGDRPRGDRPRGEGDRERSRGEGRSDRPALVDGRRPRTEETAETRAPQDAVAAAPRREAAPKREVPPPAPPSNTPEMVIVQIVPERRTEAAMILLKRESAGGRALIIARSHHETRRLAQKLERAAGGKVAFLNAHMSKGARQAVTDRFLQGVEPWLVTTEEDAREFSDGNVAAWVYVGVPTVGPDLPRPARLFVVTTGQHEADVKTLSTTANLGSETLALPPRQANNVDVEDAPAEAPAPVEAPAPAPRARRGTTKLVLPVEAEAPAAAPVAVEPEPEVPVKPAPRRRGTAALKLEAAEAAPEKAPAKGGGARRAPVKGGLAGQETGRDAGALLDEGSAERSTTGPLVPLPRMRTSWQSFYVDLGKNHRLGRDSSHTWLSQQTGVARSSLRSILVHPTHLTVDVEGKEVDRFLAAFGSKARET